MLRSSLRGLGSERETVKVHVTRLMAKLGIEAAHEDDAHELLERLQRASEVRASAWGS